MTIKEFLKAHKGKSMSEIVKCKDCKYGHFIVPYKEAKVNHNLLKYQYNKIKGHHNPNFYCGYAVKKSRKR